MLLIRLWSTVLDVLVQCLRITDVISVKAPSGVAMPRFSSANRVWKGNHHTEETDSDGCD